MPRPTEDQINAHFASVRAMRLQQKPSTADRVCNVLALLAVGVVVALVVIMACGTVQTMIQ